ncbi:phage head-tail connector protein [Aminipila sp.]|uniref:phage head-tail connector protein n=1 Tax=Aminipila sp. TaxID=2060095 RepID=UPI002899F763|nr:phage head-tail connector protein [Aminipila sp.]
MSTIEERILASLKLRVKNVSDELLKDLTTDAITDVRTFTNISKDEELPGGCETIVKDLVVRKINRLGSEGIASESHSGVSQTYEPDLPEDIKKKLNRFRRLP